MLLLKISNIQLISLFFGLAVIAYFIYKKLTEGGFIIHPNEEVDIDIVVFSGAKTLTDLRIDSSLLVTPTSFNSIADAKEYIKDNSIICPSSTIDENEHKISCLEITDYSYSSNYYETNNPVDITTKAVIVSTIGLNPYFQKSASDENFDEEKLVYIVRRNPCF